MSEIVSAGIRSLLNPGNVCLVGARDGDRSWPDRIHSNLERFGYEGTVYPVNPKRDEVWGKAAYDTLRDVPETPDHALIIVPPVAAVEAVADAIAAGARSGTIMSGGFDHEQLETIRAAVRDSPGFVLSGPNCLGNVSVPAKAVTTTDDRLAELIDGPVAIVGQSGGIIMALNRLLTSRGIGARYAVSSGNETCLTTADFIEYFATDHDVRVVVAFVESIRDWPRFAEAALALRGSGKFLVALKVGRSDRTREAAASHTGALAGSYEAFRVVSARLGVITVNSIEAAVEAAEFLARSPAPAGDGIAAITISGGVRELLLDGAERTGETFAQLQPGTREQLVALIDDDVADNPLDTGYAGISSPEVLIQCAEIMAADPAIDVVLLQEELLGRADPRKLASLRLMNERFAGGTVAGTGVPVSFFSMATVHVSDYGRQLRREISDLPFLQGAGPSAEAVGVIGRTERTFRRSGAPAIRPKPSTRPQVRPGALSETESRALFESYGFRFPAGGIAHSEDEAVSIAETAEYPVVLKVDAPGLVHKSDAGGVMLAISGEEALRSAFRTMMAAFPDAAGCLVAHQVPADRVEIVLGCVHDPEVGPVVLVGSGGVDAELDRDVALVPVPCSPEEAREALTGTRVGTLLGGWRGRRACDIQAAVDAICRLADLAADLGSTLVSAEINPLALIPGATGAWALDAFVETGDPR